MSCSNGFCEGFATKDAKALLEEFASLRSNVLRAWPQGPILLRSWPGSARPSTKLHKPVVEILPIRVVDKDQSNLPSARIMLDVLLALPRQADVPMALGVNEALQAIVW
jgi:hypothetical protein